MQSNVKRGVRYMLQVAILAGLAGGAMSVPTAFAASSVEQQAVQTDQLQAQAQTNWRETISHLSAPADGCFEAEYPSTTWKQVACNTAPARAHSIPPVPPHHLTLLSGGGQTVGNGNDYALKSNTLITSTVGSFPSVTGVTSESGVGVSSFGGGGILGPNEYTLQINTDFNSTTSSCAGHSGCVVWQQFIYSPDYNVDGQAAVFMQYWLIGWGSSRCPSGFGSDGEGDCYGNSSAATAPDVPATQLANLKLTGTVVNGGNDTVTFTNGTHAYSASGSDSKLHIASVWKSSEFNVVGNAGGSKAQFNSGSSVTVKVAVSNGSTSAPTCASNAGSTGETNNLTLHSCTTAGGSNPSIQFTESN
ncbi:hypothetical protein [Dyella sp.]|uniref:hypothetical protein n=1 Tax=Dyella sp. TaxID=1869338 RepID=UPI002ED15905